MTTPAVPMTDAELIARTRGGDMTAFDELYRRHADDARRVARLVSDNSDEADDISAEAFTRVLAALQSGGGPDGELAPYLRTVVRRLAFDRYRASRRDGTPADPALLEELPEPDDPAARVTDRDLVRRAFETLPDRWQRVLWHTEIEGRSPAELASTLGSTPNAVAALAYRAREGLRQAYLSVHLSSAIPDECRPYVPKLAAYVRGTLTPSDDQWVSDHLDQCQHCRERHDELLLLVSDLRGVLWPALLAPAVAVGGGVAAAGVAATAGAVSPDPTAAGAVAPVSGRLARRASRNPRPRSAGRLIAAAASVAAVAAVVAAAIAIGSSETPAREEPAASATSEHSTPAPSPTPRSTSPTPTATPSPTSTTLAPITRPARIPAAEPEPESADPVANSQAGGSSEPTERRRGPKWCDAVPDWWPHESLPASCRR
ncbi:MAG TPA: sigma-70 family RNA polymerase sigma factor [Jiangellaceae bacterium]|nr:sigma-70 family RNA polymerase sigma factor [Jiangellaceae bacterium]